MGKLTQKITENSNLAMILAGYAKRILEKQYTDVFKTPLGQKLKDIGQAEKYTIEFLLNALTAFVEKKMRCRYRS